MLARRMLGLGLRCCVRAAGTKHEPRLTRSVSHLIHTTENRCKCASFGVATDVFRRRFSSRTTNVTSRTLFVCGGCGAEHLGLVNACCECGESDSLLRSVAVRQEEIAVLVGMANSKGFAVHDRTSFRLSPERADSVSVPRELSGGSHPSTTTSQLALDLARMIAGSLSVAAHSSTVAASAAVSVSPSDGSPMKHVHTSDESNSVHPATHLNDASAMTEDGQLVNWIASLLPAAIHLAATMSGHRAPDSVRDPTHQVDSCDWLGIRESLNQRVYPIIDLRSPKEYALGHVPSAINLPLLDNEERHEVGLLYKQASPAQAVQRGLELFGAKAEAFAAAVEGILLPSREVALYCWRGGLRSRLVSV